MSREPRPTGIGPDRWGEILGLEILEQSPERIRARVSADERHQQPYGILHGGVYCSIVEGVASYGAGQALRARGGGRIVGVSNHTDFLRTHSRGELHAEGEPLHVGRRVQLWEVRIRRASDDALVAHGKVRFQLLEETPPGSD